MFEISQFSLLNIEDALVNCGDKELLYDMLQLMLAELPRDLEEMKQAYVEKNYSKIKNLAHKIKGGAVYIGTNRMKYACQYLEIYCNGDNYLFHSLYQKAINTIEETITYTKKQKIMQGKINIPYMNEF